MKLLKLNNEYYLLGDDELEIKGGDTYYVNGHVTESACGEIDKGDYKDCEKVLASTVQLRGLPLIDRNEIEYILKEKLMALGRKKMRELNPHSLLTNAMLDDFAEKFYFGYIEASKEKKYSLEDMARFGLWYRTWYGHPKVGTESYFAAKHFAESMENNERWDYVSVEGTITNYHSKKWNKTVGRTIPSVNEKGYVTIKSIHEK